MRNHEDGSTHRPSNAFTPEFLARLDQQDEPLTAAQADVAGPWIVVPIPSPEGAKAYSLGREPGRGRPAHRGLPRARAGAPRRRGALRNRLRSPLPA